MLLRGGLLKVCNMNRLRSLTQVLNLRVVHLSASHSSKPSSVSPSCSVASRGCEPNLPADSLQGQDWHTSGRGMMWLERHPSRTMFSLSCSDCDWLHRKQHATPSRLYHVVVHGKWSYVPSCSVDKNFPRRWMSYKKRKGRKQQMEEDEEEEDLDEEAEDDVEFDVEEDGPPGYKDIKVHLKSLRVDAVASTGLGMARNKAEEYFYSSKMRLTGEKILKKSKQMAEGDYVDVITDTGETTLQVKRVKVLRIMPERTQKDKFVVYIRAWRSAFEIPNPDERSF